MAPRKQEPEPYRGLDELVARHREGFEISDRAALREANIILLAHKTMDGGDSVSIPLELLELLAAKLARGLMWAAGRRDRARKKGAEREAAWVPYARAMKARHPDWSARRLALEVVKNCPGSGKPDTIRRKFKKVGIAVGL